MPVNHNNHHGKEEIRITTQLVRDLYLLRVRGQINAAFLLYPSACSELSKFNQRAISRVFSVDHKALKCFLSPSVWYDKHCIYMPCFDELNATYSIAHIRTSLSIAKKLTQFDALKTLLVAEGISTTASDAARVISDIVRRKNKSESDIPLRPGPMWYEMLSTDTTISHTTIRGIILFLFDVEGIDGISRHICPSATHESVYYDTHGRIFRVSVTDSDVDDSYIVAVYECDACDTDATLELLDKMMEARAEAEDDVWVCLSRCIAVRKAERRRGISCSIMRTRKHTIDFFHPTDRNAFLRTCMALTCYMLNTNNVDTDEGSGVFWIRDNPGIRVEYVVGLVHVEAPFESGLMHPVMLRMHIKSSKRADISISTCIKATAQMCNGHDSTLSSEDPKYSTSVSFDDVPILPPTHKAIPPAGQC